jgi:hypothetical protein
VAPEYLHELTVFPKGKHDDQVDSTAQMLDWLKRGTSSSWGAGIFELYRQRAEELRSGEARRDLPVRLRAPRGVGAVQLLSGAPRLQDAAPRGGGSEPGRARRPDQDCDLRRENPWRRCGASPVPTKPRSSTSCAACITNSKKNRRPRQCCGRSPSGRAVSPGVGKPQHDRARGDGLPHRISEGEGGGC